MRPSGPLMPARRIVSAHERDRRNASMSTAGTSSSNRATAWLSGWLSATVIRTAACATTVPLLSPVMGPPVIAFRKVRSLNPLVATVPRPVRSLNFCAYTGVMALPSDYPDQSCSLARSLEVVGQRWTLLVLRGAFYGVQRFDDFASHLKLPRAVLSERLKSLTAAGLVERVTGSTGRGEYRLTDKGTALWPAVRALLVWGDEYY